MYAYEESDKNVINTCEMCNPATIVRELQVSSQVRVVLT